MKIYLDILINHTADVIRNAENEYAHRSKAAFPYKDSAGNQFDDRNSTRDRSSVGRPEP